MRVFFLLHFVKLINGIIINTLDDFQHRGTRGMRIKLRIKNKELFVQILKEFMLPLMKSAEIKSLIIVQELRPTFNIR